MSSKETTTGNPKKDNMKWKEVTISGLSGVMLGGAAAYATTASAMDVTDQDIDENAETQEEETDVTVEDTSTVEAHGNVAGGVSDSMSFNEAFAAARQEVGAGGCFVWHGNVYSTYYSQEWNAMSSAEREQFVSQTTGVDTSHSHATYAHHTEAGTTATAQETDDDDTTFEAISIEQVEATDGSTMNVGTASINGHAAVFFEANGNGEFDYMGVDANDNGEFDSGEIVDVSDSHMQVAQFEQLVQGEPSNIDEPTVIDDPAQEYYASNEDLPDYVNDADPGTLA